MYQHPRRASVRCRGFTLVELLASIVVVGILAAFGIRKYGENQERIRVGRAIMELQAIQMQLATMDPLPNSLAEIGRGTATDPWGNLYVYFRFTEFNNGVPKGARRDKNLRPINTDFDLYSVGKDGATSANLMASKSRDDIVVANDGKYVGLAERY